MQREKNAEERITLLCEAAIHVGLEQVVSSAQSYDLICIVPKRILLKTVIPG